MLISLAVILIPCILIYKWFSRVPDAPQVDPVKYQPVVARADKQAKFDLISPQALPDTWKPIKATWKDQQLQLGFLSPDTVYYEERAAQGANDDDMVNDASRNARADGTTVVGKRTWTKLVTDDGRTRCLLYVVKTGKPSTTVVCADTEYEGVEAFVSTLA